MKAWILSLSGITLTACASLAWAQANEWQAGLVLDTAVTSRQP